MKTNILAAFGAVVLLSLVAVALMGATKTLSTTQPTTGACESFVQFDDQDAALPMSNIAIMTLDWTSNADGSCTASIPAVFGEILRVVTVPGEDTAKPSDNYDLVLSDRDGLDLLNSLGANRDETNAEQFVPRLTITTNVESVPLVMGGGFVELAVTNAGDSKSGRVRIYLKR